MRFSGDPKVGMRGIWGGEGARREGRRRKHSEQPGLAAVGCGGEMLAARGLDGQAIFGKYVLRMCFFVLICSSYPGPINSR